MTYVCGVYFYGFLKKCFVLLYACSGHVIVYSSTRWCVNDSTCKKVHILSFGFYIYVTCLFKLVSSVAFSDNTRTWPMLDYSEPKIIENSYCTPSPLSPFLFSLPLSFPFLFLPLPPFRNRSPQNQGVSGSAVSSASGVWGRAPAEIEFDAF